MNKNVGLKTQIFYVNKQNENDCLFIDKQTLMNPLTNGWTLNKNTSTASWFR